MWRFLFVHDYTKSRKLNIHLCTLFFNELHILLHCSCMEMVIIRATKGCQHHDSRLHIGKMTMIKTLEISLLQKKCIEKNERSRAVASFTVRDFCCNIHVTRVATFFFSALFLHHNQSFFTLEKNLVYSLQVPESVSIVPNTVPTVFITCLIWKMKRAAFKKPIAPNWLRHPLENSDWVRIATESWHFWHRILLQVVVVVMVSILDSFRKIEFWPLRNYILDGCI